MDQKEHALCSAIPSSLYNFQSSLLLLLIKAASYSVGREMPEIKIKGQAGAPGIDTLR